MWYKGKMLLMILCSIGLLLTACGHAWCEVNLNGEIYIFDPQIEDRVVSNGKIKYSYFFKTYDERAGKYIKAE
ncbi:MAG: hypothetical protein IJ419_03520 [Agathobacter sp.]|nr:hypothetical protein [Agathobacter sp.]